jgi:hypothetical protein
MSTHWNSSNSMQKAVNLTTPAKKQKENEYIIDMNFRIRKIIILTFWLVLNWPSKSA